MASIVAFADPVTISYASLRDSPESLTDAIAKAFGSEDACLGIIVIKDLPPVYPDLRNRLLLLASKFAALDETTKESYSDPASNFSFGWSFGKELMNGVPDHLKGSFYANPIVDRPVVSEALRAEHPESYGLNIWPRADEKGIEGFEEAFKELGRFMFAVGCKLAEACQPFVSNHMRDSNISLPGLLSRSQTQKARLLHYFPPSPHTSIQGDDDNEPIDSWCGFHKDHSMITGLCSAMYLAHPPLGDGEAKIVPPPNPMSGLYIRTRGGDLRKVAIPVDALAFQTGEALEILTDGKLRATPHCVRIGSRPSQDIPVSRETMAFFMQPDVTEQLSPTLTYGQFSKEIIQSHYAVQA